MLRIVPVTLKTASNFVRENHRHNGPVTGHKFSLGLKNGDVLVGVANAGRPIARHLDDGLTLEVNRTCTDGTRNANSMLYGAIWQAARAMGYRRCITYTQAEETGSSLRAAGWIKVKELAPRADWNCKSRPRENKGTGNVARILWMIERPLTVEDLLEL